ncbi:MAG: alpha-2-macroglobulin, partial [Myxococcales bacterium]|nr:alpha-2-macroglobulin [Myxococcales bacterium]
SVAVTTDREVYAPGEQAEVTFELTDAEGIGRAAAIGLQIVDEAVFSLLEFRPGLERVYFRLEGELAEPRYQIGVPNLATLTAQPGAEQDPVAQAEAGILFAASGDVDGPGVAVNTYQQAQSRVANVVKPAIEAIVNTLATTLQQELGYGADVEAARMRLTMERQYDPWGQLLVITVDNNQARFLSSGPDERLDTADDITVTRNTYCELLGDCPQAGGEFDNDGDFAGGPGGVPEAPNAGGGDRGDPSEGGADRPRVRRDFPETLLVEPALITDGQGRATLSVPLADSITTWRLSALANTQAGLLGSTEAGIRVFQDFFVDVAFPATLTRGDEYTVPIALYNYLDTPQSVRLEVQPAEWLTLLGEANQVVELAPNEVRGVDLPVRVEKVGIHALTVFAIGDSLQDAVERVVEVVPDGQEVRQSWSGRLDEPVNREIMLPAEAIEGSGKLLVKLYPGLFSAAVEGLDNILRMPSGCFEQTSSTTWPNVLVVRYLRETGTVTPELEATAMGYVNTGYQRLLTFEVDGGGFEWFGNDPAHTVLTAYGLLEFVDMAGVRTVDEAMIARTRAWLLEQQAADGHFEVASRGLDETGNLTDPVTVTAYVAFALAAAGENGAEMALAKTFLQGELADMGTYTLALFANFLVAYEPNGGLTGQVLDRLASEVEESLGNHWQTDEQTTTYGQGEPAYIETTALATHALLKAGAARGVTQAALDWLITKKDSYGTWGSTAGTVWTIKCLLEALASQPDENANATVRVLLDDVERATFQVTPDNSDVLRQADLREWLVAGMPQQVSILIEGQGNLQYGIVQAYHVPYDGPAPGEGPLHIDVSYDRTSLTVDDTVNVSVDVRNDSLEFADMVMVDLGIPPGFDLVTDDVDALVEQGVIRRYERTERQLLLYFQVILPDAPVHFEYRIVARNPIRAQAPAARVYSYYNPDVESEGEPIEVEVQ